MKRASSLSLSLVRTGWGSDKQADQVKKPISLSMMLYRINRTRTWETTRRTRQNPSGTPLAYRKGRRLGRQVSGKVGFLL